MRELNAQKERVMRLRDYSSDTNIAVKLRGELMRFVDEMIESGLYSNYAELIRDSIRRLREQGGLKRF